MTDDRVPWPRELRRVVVVAPCVPEASGGSRAVENYVEMFTSLGVVVEVVSMYPGTRTAGFTPRVVVRRRELHRGPVLRGRTGGWRRLGLIPVVAFKRVDWLLAMRRYCAFMASLGGDTLVLFTHVTPLSMLHDAGFDWGAARPVLVGQHHSPFVSVEDDTVLFERIVREFAHVDGFVALTPEDAVRFAEVLPVPCYDLPNPAQRRDEQWSVAHTEPPVGDGTPGRPRTVVALARLSRVKQLDLMIRAFARATEAVPAAAWCLDIYGDGQERDALEQVIDEAGARDRVRLMGEVDDVGPVLATASLHLLSSRYEGLPMSILEAAQSGVPTLAFASSPALAAMVTELHGRVVNPAGDEDAYVEALRELLVDEKSLRAAGTQARAATARYAQDVVAGRWARVVTDLLDRRAAS